MRWSGRAVALAIIAGSVGGGLAVLVHDWVLGLSLWSPGRLGVTLALGALIGFLCTLVVRPNDR
jgi:hypothetical protein